MVFALPAIYMLSSHQTTIIPHRVHYSGCGLTFTLVYSTHIDVMPFYPSPSLSSFLLFNFFPLSFSLCYLYSTSLYLFSFTFIFTSLYLYFSLSLLLFTFTYLYCLLTISLPYFSCVLFLSSRRLYLGRPTTGATSSPMKGNVSSHPDPRSRCRPVPPQGWSNGFSSWPRLLHQVGFN